MNKTLILASGVALTFAVCCGLSFFVMRYFKDLPLTILGFMLVAVAGSGMTLTLEKYDKNAPHTQQNTNGKIEKPEVLLLTEDQILANLNEKPPKPETILEPEIITRNAIIPVKDQVKTVMQNKIVEALQKSRVTVEINGKMDMDGNFTTPEITFGFSNDPISPSEKPAISKPLKPEDERLRKPRL